MTGAVIYDLETYPNCFLAGVVDLHSNTRFMFELSDRRDDRNEMVNFLHQAMYHGAEMIGFNNLNFDYPIIHDILRSPATASYQTTYEKAMSIINSSNRWAHQIWANNRFIPQIDLYRLNHFDNFAKNTSLKALQFVMRAESVEDLPIPPGTILTSEQIEIVREYCDHDLDETKRFARVCQPDIDFRRTLQPTLGPEAINWADVKIGSEYFINTLGKRACYYYDENNKRQIIQTQRSSINCADIVFPYISFELPQCQNLLQQVKETTITTTRSGIKTAVDIDGFQFDFGTGGIHGSRANQIFHSDDDHVIIDADVTSLYPSIAIVNKLYPEHLGHAFVTQYALLREQRKLHAKGTPENATLKLALNGTYGNSNSDWSPFKDPQFTMAITINGQLLLLMLAESLTRIEGVKLIQINTDGVTFLCPRGKRDEAMKVCANWEKLTALDLEYVDYKSFFCRDVNNYLAVGTDDKVKAKGAYWFPKTAKEYSGWWHRNYSAQIVQRAVESELLGLETVESFIKGWKDPFDFMLRGKCPRSSKLIHNGQEQQRITRFFASVKGDELYKESPPVAGAEPGDYKRKSKIEDALYFSVLREIEPGVWDERIHTKNKSVYEDRRIKVHERCCICNDVEDFDWTNLDYDYYISEARKLIDCLEPAEVDDTSF